MCSAHSGFYLDHFIKCCVQERAQGKIKGGRNDIREAKVTGGSVKARE